MPRKREKKRRREGGGRRCTLRPPLARPHSPRAGRATPSTRNPHLCEPPSATSAERPRSGPPSPPPPCPPSTAARAQRAQASLPRLAAPFSNGAQRLRFDQGVPCSLPLSLVLRDAQPAAASLARTDRGQDSIRFRGAPVAPRDGRPTRRCHHALTEDAQIGSWVRARAALLGRDCLPARRWILRGVAAPSEDDCDRFACVNRLTGDCRGRPPKLARANWGGGRSMRQGMGAPRGAARAARPSTVSELRLHRRAPPRPRAWVGRRRRAARRGAGGFARRHRSDSTQRGSGARRLPPRGRLVARMWASSHARCAGAVSRDAWAVQHTVTVGGERARWPCR